MAGKVHTDYMAHESGLHPLMTPGRRSQAYAEGYQAQINGGVEEDNPHPSDDDIGSSYFCWWRGFRDASAGFSSSHVGGPDGEVVEPAKHHKGKHHEKNHHR